MQTRILTVLSCLVLLGCGETPQPPPPAPAGPTYAEALTIYNQELDLLERLKASARAEEAAYEEKVTRLKTSAALGDVVKDFQTAADLATAGNLLNEEETAQAQAASEKARDKLGEMSAKASADVEKLAKEHEARMAELNESIAEQEAKVQKAKQVKDEAEQRK